jgi:GT2 family glycosyltransferase
VNEHTVSIVVISHNEGGHLRMTVDAMRDTTPASTEIVIIDDFSADGSTEFLSGPDYREVRLIRPDNRLGISAARNLGAERSHGDVIVFSDAHVRPAPGWLPPLIDALDDDTVGAVAPAVSALGCESSKGYGFSWSDPSLTMRWCYDRPAQAHPVPFLCGCFLASRREVFDRCGRFDDGLIKWGFEDSEYCLRLWRSGYRCMVEPASDIAHLFRTKFPYQVEWESTTHNQLRTALLHLSRPRCRRVFEQARGSPRFELAVSLLFESDLDERRQFCAAIQKHTDDTIFEMLGIPEWKLT